MNPHPDRHGGAEDGVLDTTAAVVAVAPFARPAAWPSRTRPPGGSGWAAPGAPAPGPRPAATDRPARAGARQRSGGRGPRSPRRRHHDQGHGLDDDAGRAEHVAGETAEPSVGQRRDARRGDRAGEPSPTRPRHTGAGDRPRSRRAPRRLPPRRPAAARRRRPGPDRPRHGRREGHRPRPPSPCAPRTRCPARSATQRQPVDRPRWPARSTAGAGSSRRRRPRTHRRPARPSPPADAPGPGAAAARRRCRPARRGGARRSARGRPRPSVPPATAGRPPPPSAPAHQPARRTDGHPDRTEPHEAATAPGRALVRGWSGTTARRGSGSHLLGRPGQAEHPAGHDEPDVVGDKGDRLVQRAHDIDEAAPRLRGWVHREADLLRDHDRRAAAARSVRPRARRRRPPGRDAPPPRCPGRRSASRHRGSSGSAPIRSPPASTVTHSFGRGSRWAAMRSAMAGSSGAAHPVAT